MSDRINLVILTESAIGGRIIPPLLGLPEETRITVSRHLEDALGELSPTGANLFVADLRCPAGSVAALTKLLEQDRLPPTILVGEKWHLSDRLADRLGPRLAFVRLPLEPIAVGAAAEQVMPAILDRSAELSRLDSESPEPDSISAGPIEVEPAITDSVDDLVARLEELLGEHNG